MMNVQIYLRNGNSLADLERDYNIKSRGSVDGRRVSLTYGVGDANMLEPIVRECRGLILEVDTWSVVARPFDRFFNHGQEGADDIDWPTARAYEKVDGTLIILYYYAGRWRFATRGEPDAGGSVHGAELTFNDYANQALLVESPDCEGWDILGEADGARVDLTYCFELTGPLNRIVVPYSKPKLTLLGARVTATGDGVCLEVASLLLMGWFPGIAVAKSYPLQSIEDITSSFEDFSPLDQEGYVICDYQFNRIKVKHPSYAAIHHAATNRTGFRALLDVARKGDRHPAEADFPVVNDEMRAIRNRIALLTHDLVCDYESICHIESQKDFANLAKKTRWPAIMFVLRRSKASLHLEHLLTIESHMATIPIKTMERVLTELKVDSRTTP